jgi:hypothetical protein
MPLPRNVRSGFVGIPGPRARRRFDAELAEGEASDLAARYAEAVRRHDEAATALRRLTDEMAASLRRQGVATAAAVPGPYEVAPDAGGIAPEAAGEGSAAESEALANGARRRRKPENESDESDRPTNLRGERNPDTGSVCLSWDATPREGLIFGVWRSVAPREGPSTAFERIAMVREAGYIDGAAPDPAEARRISYAVRALDGRRPVPGSAHVSVTLDSDE